MVTSTIPLDRHQGQQKPNARSSKTQRDAQTVAVAHASVLLKFGRSHLSTFYTVEDYHVTLYKYIPLMQRS